MTTLAALGTGAAPVELVVSGKGDAEVQAPAIIRRATEVSVAAETAAPVAPNTERTGGREGTMRSRALLLLLAVLAQTACGTSDGRIAEGEEPMVALHVRHPSRGYGIEYWRAQARASTALWSIAVQFCRTEGRDLAAHPNCASVTAADAETRTHSGRLPAQVRLVSTWARRAPRPRSGGVRTRTHARLPRSSGAARRRGSAACITAAVGAFRGKGALAALLRVPTGTRVGPARTRRTRLGGKLGIQL